MQNHFQVNISVGNDLEREIMIAQLNAIGFEGFEEEPGILKAFITETKFDRDEFHRLMNEYEVKFDIELVAARNWNEEWEKNFEPVVIADFCSVRAGFHAPNPQTKFELIITPKMSFGTGHHATTFMMLQLMEHLEMREKTVLDFGTGTGILAIMAEKLGAKEVVAIDVDEWSIENAKENLALNECSRTQLYKSDNIPENKSFKIILANINRNVILEQLPVMCKLLEAKGELLLSGLLEKDYKIMQAEAIKYRLCLHNKSEKSGWIALRYILVD